MTSTAMTQAPPSEMHAAICETTIFPMRPILPLYLCTRHSEPRYGTKKYLQLPSLLAQPFRIPVCLCHHPHATPLVCCSWMMPHVVCCINVSHAAFFPASSDMSVSLLTPIIAIAPILSHTYDSGNFPWQMVLLYTTASHVYITGPNLLWMEIEY